MVRARDLHPAEGEAAALPDKDRKDVAAPLTRLQRRRLRKRQRDDAFAELALTDEDRRLARETLDRLR